MPPNARLRRFLFALCASVAFLTTLLAWSGTAAAAPTCTYALTPATATVAAGGGTATFQVSTQGSCAWTATTTASFITGLTQTGTGNSQVSYTVAANTGAARSGSITVSGQTFTVNQATGCTLAVNPASSPSQPATGSTSSFAVTTGAGCAWTASTSATWLSGVTASGTGGGTVTYSVAANTNAARSAPITVALAAAAGGATAAHTVNQGSGCTVSINPATASPGNAGGVGSFEVFTGTGCVWTTSETSSFVSNVSATGTGAGTVSYTVDGNPGAQRSASIQISVGAASATFAITQGNGCSASISPSTLSRGPAAGTASFNVVMSSSECTWTATSGSPFLTNVTAAGTGSGPIAFDYAANVGAPRSGTITVNGVTFTLQQEDGCVASLDPTSASTTAAGGAGSFGILMSDPSCAWTASTATTFIRNVTANGSGNGPVSYEVDANGGPARAGTITAGGQTFSISQASGCAVSLPVNAGDVSTDGGSSSFLVATTAPGCGYQAVSSAPWLNATTTATGVQYTAAASGAASRQATITVSSTTTASSATFTVSQLPGCVLTLSSNGVTATKTAVASASFGVTAGAGCTWTAASNDAWLGSVSVTGAGVAYAVAANDGPARTGTITVTNPETNKIAVFGVTQASGCTITIPTATGAAEAGGGPGAFPYTSGPGCKVTASSNASWLSNFAAASGTFTYAVAQSNQAPRVGIIQVTTADTGSSGSFTVSQGSGCSVTLAASSASVVPVGATSTFQVTTGFGCTYLASSAEPWLAGIGVSATGVSFTAASNGSLARTGAIVVTSTTTSSKQTFTVNQEGAVGVPVITRQPTGLTMTEGTLLSLRVEATGGSLFYQWMKAGAPVAGANGPSYSRGAASFADAGDYTVVITNAAGSVTSNVAAVTVKASSLLPDGGTSTGTSGGTSGGSSGATASGGLTDDNNLAPAGDEGGCSAAPGTRSGSLAGLVGLAIALAFAARRRRAA